MKRFEATTTIARPPATVWTYAAAIARQDEWMSVADARATQGDGTHAGDRGRALSTFGPFKWDLQFVVTAAEPGRRVVWEANDPRIDWEVGLHLEPIGDGETAATYTGVVHMHGRWRLLTPLVAIDGESSLRKELERLRANLESSPVVSPAIS